MQTRSGKTYTNPGNNNPRSNISNEFAELLGKPVDGKTLCVQDLRRMFRHIIDKYAVRGEPKKISNELAKFLGKPVGSKMLRSEVYRHIDTYAETNNLIDNDARIRLDKKLASIIKLGQNEELSCFNIIKYTNHHFV
jgi:chromatin remodeling complex protein RSC6